MVDLTNGVSRVESGKNGQGRVQGLFLPGSAGPVGKPGGEDGAVADPGAAIPLMRNQLSCPPGRAHPWWRAGPIGPCAAR